MASRYDWIWDEAHQNHYRATLESNGTWTYIWKPKNSVPVPSTAASSSNSASRILIARPGTTQSALGSSSHPAGMYVPQHGSSQYAYTALHPNQLSAGFVRMSVADTSSRPGPVHGRSSTTGGPDQDTYSQNPPNAGSRPTALHTISGVSNARDSAYSQSPTHGGSRPVPQTHVSSATSDANNRSYPVQPGIGSGSRSGSQVLQVVNNTYRNVGTQVEERSIYADNKLRIRGTEGPREYLDPSYQIIGSQDEWEFFEKGRVFSTLMWQAGGSAAGGPSVVKLGQEGFAKIYRLIVVQPRTKQHYSKCIRISTYGGQGVAKKSLNQKEHCIVYTGNVAPTRLPGETNMNKDPIQMEPVTLSEKLDPLSRADLARTYPVEHNVRVKNVGMISKVHLKRLLANVQDCQ